MYRILVTDDEEKIRALIRKYAQFEGHSVTEAGTGVEAVELCRRESFDIIIMDIMMPTSMALAPLKKSANSAPYGHNALRERRGIRPHLLHVEHSRRLH